MLIFSYSDSDWQLSTPSQVRTSSFPLEHLYVDEDRFSKQYWQDDIDNMQWLEKFQPFTAVKNLFQSKKFVSCIATTDHPARSQRRKGDRGVTHPGKHFFGRVSAIGICPGSPLEVCRRATALGSPYNRFSMGRCKTSDTRVILDECLPHRLQYIS
jgi:hypothetical protein